MLGILRNTLAHTRSLLANTHIHSTG